MVKIKKRLATIAIVGSVAAVSSATLSVAPASAANNTPCGNRTDLVEVLGHVVGRPGNFDKCYANAGSVQFARDDWASWIKTGNNRVCFKDWDGDMVFLQKNERYQPSAEFHLEKITILRPNEERPSKCKPAT